GLNEAGKATKHVAHGSARVLGLKLKEDVVLVGQYYKEMPFPTGLSPPARQGLGLNGNARCVGRQAESVLLGVLRAGEHDLTQRCADILDRARHATSVQVDPVSSEHLLLPVIRYAVAEFAGDDVSQHARCEDAAPEQLPWQRCRF